MFFSVKKTNRRQQQLIAKTESGFLNRVLHTVTVSRGAKGRGCVIFGAIVPSEIGLKKYILQFATIGSIMSSVGLKKSLKTDF
jgi:hypothetical protein